MRKFTFLFAGLMGISGVAHAQDYPSRPIQLVVPYAPGGITDVAARMVAQRLEQELGHSIVVENRAGAATTVASNYIARQKPDGYTLYAASVSLPLNKYLQSGVQYDAFKDFTVISGFTDSPFVLQASKSMGVSNMNDLVAKLKEKPGHYTLGASGVGAMNHIASETWLKQADVDALIVQYQGGSQVRMAILGGDINLTFATLNEAQPLLADGQTIPIAVTTSERVDSLPEVPTIKETLGLEKFEVIFWTALLAPQGLPDDIANKLRTAMKAVGEDNDLRQKLAVQGVVLNVTNEEDTIKRMHAAVDTFAPIIQDFQQAQK